MMRTLGSPVCISMRSPPLPASSAATVCRSPSPPAPDLGIDSCPAGIVRGRGDAGRPPPLPTCSTWATRAGRQAAAGQRTQRAQRPAARSPAIASTGSPAAPVRLRADATQPGQQPRRLPPAGHLPGDPPLQLVQQPAVRGDRTPAAVRAASRSWLAELLPAPAGSRRSPPGARAAGRGRRWRQIARRRAAPATSSLAGQLMAALRARPPRSDPVAIAKRAQLRPGDADLRAHGGGRRAEDVGHLLGGQPLQVAQHQRGPLLLGQRLQRPGHQPLVLAGPWRWPRRRARCAARQAPRAASRS